MLNTLGRKGIAAVGAVVCVVVLVAGWFLLVAPLRSDIDKTKADTQTQVESNDTARLKLANMRSIAKKLPQEQAELAALAQRVPDSAELPNLLRSIQKAANLDGVTLVSLAPTAPTALTNAPGISAVSISMSVTGGFAETEQFDKDLEGLKRTFLVTGFSMDGGAATPTGSSTGAIVDPDAAEITTSFSGQVLLKTSTAATATAGS